MTIIQFGRRHAIAVSQAESLVREVHTHGVTADATDKAERLIGELLTLKSAAESDGKDSRQLRFWISRLSTTYRLFEKPSEVWVEY